MRILLDPQIFNDQKYGGISRYYTEIFSRLNQQKGIDIELPILTADNVYLHNSQLFSERHKKALSLLKMVNSLGISIRKVIRKKNVKKTQKALQQQDFDVFIPTYYNPYFLESIGNKPFVLTVYDMIHELFSEYFSEDDTTRANKLVLMEKSAKIIAVSENTKKDILKLYPHLDASKIEVIHHGSSIKIDKNIQLELPEKYILFVGVRNSYKNFIFFINSIHQLLKNDPELQVVCAGGGDFNDEEKQLFHQLDIVNQVQFRNFKDNELGTYYQNALCFVFPSMYEGFGIPVLESMAAGCPIVLTNNSSFPEVAGEAGVFFELNNGDDLKNKIRSLIENENLRKEYSAKGYEQIKKFDWDNAAQQCLQLYQKAIN